MKTTKNPSPQVQAASATIAAASVQGRRLVRPKEACAYLKIEHSTLYELIRRGTIPRPFKLGQRITLIDLDDLDRLLETQAT